MLVMAHYMPATSALILDLRDLRKRYGYITVARFQRDNEEVLTLTDKGRKYAEQEHLEPFNAPARRIPPHVCAVSDDDASLLRKIATNQNGFVFIRDLEPCEIEWMMRTLRPQKLVEIRQLDSLDGNSKAVILAPIGREFAKSQGWLPT